MTSRLVLLTLIVGAGCAVESQGNCIVDADCGPGSTCQEALCVSTTRFVATIQAPAAVAKGAKVTLEGGSTAGDEGLSYAWTVLEPSDLVLADPAAKAVSFDAATAHATYRLQLVVTAKGVRSEPATVRVGVLNGAPVARLTPPPAPILRSSSYTYDASGSTDPDGDELSISWKLTTDPVDPTAKLVEGDVGKVTLMTGATSTSYRVLVTVSDASGAQDSVESVLVVAKTPPVLGPCAVVQVHHDCAQNAGAIECHASGTIVADLAQAKGQTTWKLKQKPAVSEAAVVAITPVPDKSGEATFSITTDGATRISGDYEFELALEDAEGGKATAACVVQVQNRPPVVAGFIDGALTGHSYGAPRANSANGYYGNFALDTLVITDPDGDAILTRTATVGGALANKATASISGSSSASMLLFSTSASVVGAPVEVTFTAEDAQGGKGTATANFSMSNRSPGPPSLSLSGTASPSTLSCAADAAITTRMNCVATSHLGVTYLDQAGTVESGCTASAETYVTFGPVSAPVPLVPRFDATIIDPDGDPVKLTWAHESAKNDLFTLGGGGATQAFVTPCAGSSGGVVWCSAQTGLALGPAAGLKTTCGATTPTFATAVGQDTFRVTAVDEAGGTSEAELILNIVP